MKIALVTGASRGLGRNTAVALARKGIDVIGTYHSSKAEADAAVAQIAALGRKALMFQLDSGKVSASPVSVSTHPSRPLRKRTSTG